MKTRMTLIALVTLATACTQDPNPKDVSYVDMPTVELATIDETCILADKFVESMAGIRNNGSIPLQQWIGIMQGGYSPAWFWQPLLMRVYGEPSIAPITKEAGRSDAVANQHRDARVREFRSQLTVECYKTGRRGTKEWATGYQQRHANRKQTELDAKEQEGAPE